MSKKNNKKFEITKVKNVMMGYGGYLDDSGYVSVTEWCNGEGFDVSVDCGIGGHGGNSSFQISWEQWEVLKDTVKQLYKKECVK